MPNSQLDGCCVGAERRYRVSEKPEWVDRFMSKIEPEPNSGCWLWVGSLARNGYGSFVHSHKVHLAHRVSFALSGRPLDAGALVLHSCDNPLCVNPDHLRAGTHGDNMRDAANRKRFQKQQVTVCRRGHPLTGRRTAANGRPRRFCATCKQMFWSKKNQKRKGESNAQ